MLMSIVVIVIYVVVLLACAFCIIKFDWFGFDSYNEPMVGAIMAVLASIIWPVFLTLSPVIGFTILVAWLLKNAAGK